MVDSFKDALKFPLTKKEKEEKQRDEDNREKARKCRNCDKLYYEKDNNLDSCSFHPDFLTNIKGDYSVRLTKEHVIEIAREKKNQETFKDYFWLCCIKEYTCSDGCQINSDTQSYKKVQEYKKKDFLSLENVFYSIQMEYKFEKKDFLSSENGFYSIQIWNTNSKKKKFASTNTSTAHIK